MTEWTRAEFYPILKRDAGPLIAQGFEIVRDPLLPVKPFTLLDPERNACVLLRRIIG